MSFKDLRSYLEAIEKTGDLVRIKEEVDWDLEVGAIVRLSSELGKPAPFYEKLKDYPGHRMVGRVPYGRRRIALALGLPPETSWRKIQEEITTRLKYPVKPIIVKDGPCKENIIKGEEVDLFYLPAPMLAEGDGGRYIGTLSIEVVKDPDSEWVNWGTYRMMVHNGKHAGVMLTQHNHGGTIFLRKFESQGKPMPMAAVIGADPLCHIAASMPFAMGESEVDYAGALKEEPLELVKCETLDILVPPNAEIILEGEVLPGVRLPEAPFVEWTRHQSGFTMNPVFRVKAITHRHNPIITLGYSSISSEEGPLVYTQTEMYARKFLQERGIPVTEVHCPEAMGGACWVVAVKRTEEANLASRVEHCLKALMYGLPTITIVVDEDVDVYNITEVLHALAMRCHPGRNIKISYRETVNRLLPYLTSQEREQVKGGTVLFDCTWPRDWDKKDIPPRGLFKESYPEEVKAKVLSSWSKYGYK